MTLQEFKSNFGGQDLPSEMQLLFDFQDKFGAESYVAGFGLLQNDKNGLRYGWSDNEDFLKALMPFAEAGEGSIYCLWDNGTSQELNQMPIVYFDSEGEGETIIARNFLEFIQVLMIPDPYDDWRPDHYAEFIFIFNEKVKLEIPNNTDVINNACEPIQESFDQWKNQYLNI
jgi:hypothetical protein